ncbi:MAG: ferritin [Planctomycetia bacterium]|nr:ferritin [Planctomycetia bacterium]
MISKDMSEHLGRQIGAELYSEHLYNAMAAWAMAQDLPGLSHWMRLQAEEEHIHAMKLFHYILERDGEVVLPQIEAPETSWSNVQELLSSVAEHEKIITGLIYGLIDLAHQERDHSTTEFLQWYIAEQVEEEATANALIAKCKMLSEMPGGYYLLDQDLAGRQFSPELAAYLPNGAMFGKY